MTSAAAKNAPGLFSVGWMPLLAEIFPLFVLYHLKPHH
jgi:hypothetical protein